MDCWRHCGRWVLDDDLSILPGLEGILFVAFFQVSILVGLDDQERKDVE